MPAYPTEKQIRTALIRRMTAHCEAVGIQPRTLCERAINDPNFFIKLQNGGNFTVKTYQRVQRYLDEHRPRASKGRRNGGS